MLVFHYTKRKTATARFFYDRAPLEALTLQHYQSESIVRYSHYRFYVSTTDTESPYTMRNSLAIYLLLLVEGTGAFTCQPLSSSKTSFVAKPFYSSTELQSEATPSAEDEEADVDQIVVEAVGDALSEISSEGTEEKPLSFIQERFTVFLGNLPFGTCERGVPSCFWISFRLVILFCS